MMEFSGERSSWLNVARNFFSVSLASIRLLGLRFELEVLHAAVRRSDGGGSCRAARSCGHEGEDLQLGAGVLFLLDRQDLEDALEVSLDDERDGDDRAGLEMSRPRPGRAVRRWRSPPPRR